jgi:sugar phosphate isomerase/epimerase
MTTSFSRRDFARSGALAAAACATSIAVPAFTQASSTSGGKPLVRLGVASYTFRDFNRAQLIDFMKQLNVYALNAKNVKDHLPVEPAQEAKALADYAAAGIKLHAAGTIYFDKDEDDDIRGKFEYCKRAGISVIVAGDPAPKTLPRIEKFVKQYNFQFAIHNHGPHDMWSSPLDVLKAVKDMDPRMGCCIDVGHTTACGTDVIRAIHEVGPRLFNVHIKDVKNLRDEKTQVPVGNGTMPIPGIFEALGKIKYKGFVDLEYEIDPENPMPGVADSFAYMRGVLAGMKYQSHA